MSSATANLSNLTKEQTPTSDFGGREKINLNQTSNGEYVMVGMNFWGTGPHNDDLSFFQLDSL